MDQSLAEESILRKKKKSMTIKTTTRGKLTVFSSIRTCSSTPSSKKMSLTSLITSSITDLYNLGTVFVFAEFAISTHNTNKRGQAQENKIKTKPKKKKRKPKNPEGGPSHRKIGGKNFKQNQIKSNSKISKSCLKWRGYMGPHKALGIRDGKGTETL